MSLGSRRELVEHVVRNGAADAANAPRTWRAVPDTDVHIPRELVQRTHDPLLPTR